MPECANRPLAGITVLDFGQVYQGPYATLLMAKAGADVIKIEPPQGEPLRRRAPPGKSTTFPIAMLNSNKRAITLNLKHERGRALLFRMVERGDGAVLFGLAVTGTPVPQVGNASTVAAAARAYLHNLHADLTGTGVYAGLVQVAGLVADSDAARFVAENWDPSLLPEPLDPADLADTLWDLYLKRDRFEEVVGPPAAALPV